MRTFESQGHFRGAGPAFGRVGIEGPGDDVAVLHGQLLQIGLTPAPPFLRRERMLSGQ